MKKTILLLLILSALLLPASAHSGRTDENGGHIDLSTGEYHYHHGYPAHDHPNGVCPYETTETESPEPTTLAAVSTTTSSEYDRGYSDAENDIDLYLEANGYEPSYEKGHDDGYKEGYTDGYEQSKRDLEYTENDVDTAKEYGYNAGFSAGLLEGEGNGEENVREELTQKYEKELRTEEHVMLMLVIALVICVFLLIGRREK